MKGVRDNAEATRLYAMQAKDSELTFFAAEIKLQAERRAGELLRDMEKAKPSGSNQYKDRSSDATDPPKLSDVGISKDQSSRWQKVASIPEAEFEEYLGKSKESKKVPATVDIVRKVKAQERIDNLAEISKGDVDLSISQRFPVLYADPPWQYENPPIGASNRAIENHYPTMTLAEICALPVAGLATDDAILYMWATAPKLAECLEVVTA